MGAPGYVPRSGFGGTAANTPKASLVGTASQAGMMGFARSSPTPDPHPRPGLQRAGGDWCVHQQRGFAVLEPHGLVRAGKSPKFIPSLFFFFFPLCQPLRGIGATAPSWGVLLAPPLLASPGCPPWDPRPLLCRNT